MVNLKKYPAYDSRHYPLYLQFVNGFLTENPGERIEDVTEYFMVLLTNKDFHTIVLYVDLFQSKIKAQG